MNIAGRRAFVLIGVAFTIYHAARSLVWPDDVAYPWALTAMVLVIAATTLVTLVIESAHPKSNSEAPLTGGRRGPTRAPAWIGVIAVVVAAASAPVVALSVGSALVHAPFATSYLGGVGAMLAVLMVRRRPVWAWLGALALGIGTIIILGLLQAMSFGLIGAVMWVGVAQLILASLDRASRDTLRLVQLQQTAAAWQAAQSVRRRERRVRVQFALQVAGPLLAEVVATGGVLTDKDRHEALVAEGTLRDELRGAVLMDPRVRAAIENARRAGSTVTVLDEGGLAGIADDDLERIRREIAVAVAGTSASRIIIRTSRHDTVAATVVGRGTDDDSLELWHEIPRIPSSSE